MPVMCKLGRPASSSRCAGTRPSLSGSPRLRRLGAGAGGAARQGRGCEPSCARPQFLSPSCDRRTLWGQDRRLRHGRCRGREGMTGPAACAGAALRLWIWPAPRLARRRPQIVALGVLGPLFAGLCQPVQGVARPGHVLGMLGPLFAGLCLVHRSGQCGHDRLGQLGRLVVRVRPSNALFIVVAHKVPAL